MTKNLTSGQPGLVILAFAIPLIIGNVFQQVYTMADAFVVSRQIGIEALAAVTGTGSLQFLILGFLIGATSGAAIVTAQRFGAADADGVRRSFAASLILCFVITIIVMAISIATLKDLLLLLNTPKEIFEGAYQYFIVLLWGMPACMLFNLFSNMMRAVGDSRTPLYILIAACVINIVLDYLFIMFLHTGVIGAGIATVIAQLLSALACIPVIKKKLPALSFRLADFRVPLKECWAHIRVALPVGFQWSIIAIGTIAVTFVLNGLGYEAVAAFNIGQRIDQFTVLTLSSFGQAMTTFSAQNYGARKYARLRTGALHTAIIVSILSVLMGAFFILLGDKIASVFLKKNYGAIELAHTYLIVQSCFYIVLALLFVFRQLIQGTGNAMVPTISGVIELIMRTFAALFLTQVFGYTGLCFASPLAWMGCLVPLSIALILILKKLRRVEIREAKEARLHA
ncbi:MAG: MATE family efflux transporter [Spirochaetaceae bacterium]|jgi:putative MATE family efflux protein|nr:MATE family efflux transporter [Spirochaetaceae bacterium]